MCGVVEKKNISVAYIFQPPLCRVSSSRKQTPPSLIFLEITAPVILIFRPSYIHSIGGTVWAIGLPGWFFNFDNFRFRQFTKIGKFKNSTFTKIVK